MVGGRGLDKESKVIPCPQWLVGLQFTIPHRSPPAHPQVQRGEQGLKGYLSLEPWLNYLVSLNINFVYKIGGMTALPISPNCFPCKIKQCI